MRFSDLLRAVNKPSIDNFGSWVFQPGMLFHESNKWWGDLGQRDFPHEGVDFCLYKNRSGKILQLSHLTNIPAIHNGVVRQIFPDYLGQALVVEHDTTEDENSGIISIYAHVMPAKQVHIGVSVKPGDIIATIADTRQSKTTILPHLHYTIGQASGGIDYEQFLWNDMRNPDLVVLTNPLSRIRDRYL